MSRGSVSPSHFLIFGEKYKQISACQLPGSSTPETKLTIKQKTLIATLAFVNFCQTLNFSIIAPFFPGEASKKGVSSSTYGLVFGVFELVIFIMSPIYGKFVTVIGSKFLLNAGIFVSATTSILFGFLDKVYSTPVFIGLAFAVRIVEAMGGAAFMTASFAIIANNFPENVGTILGLLETFTGLGVMLGPVIGGSLYSLGGYTTPFVVMGIVLHLASLVTFFILPPQLDSTRLNSANFFTFLKIPSILIAAATITLGALSIGFINPTLEPHIRQFNLNPIQIGAVFIASAGIYAFTAPGWGYIADQKVNPKILMIIGCGLIGLGFFLIGPSPILNIKTQLWMVIVALILHGIGVGCQLVPPFSDALKQAVANGFPDNLETYGLVAGMFSSLFALGAFIGPTLGGIFIDYLQMGWTGTIFCGVEVLLGAIITIYLIHERMNKKPKTLNEEKSELLCYKETDLTIKYG